MSARRCGGQICFLPNEGKGLGLMGEILVVRWLMMMLILCQGMISQSGQVHSVEGLEKRPKTSYQGSRGQQVGVSAARARNCTMELSFQGYE